MIGSSLLGTVASSRIVVGLFLAKALKALRLAVFKSKASSKLAAVLINDALFFFIILVTVSESS